MHKILKPELVKRIEKFIIYLKDEVYEETIDLSAEYSEFEEWVPYANKDDLKYTPIKHGDKWGHPWNSAWFHIMGKVPASWNKRHIVARLQFNCELLIFDENGNPTFALTNASVWDDQYIKDRVTVTENAKGGEQISIWIEAACNGIFGLSTFADPSRNDPNRHGIFEGEIKTLKLSVFDDNVYKLLNDFEVLYSIVEALESGVPRREKIITSLNDAIDLYQYKRSNVQKSLTITNKLLSCKNGDSAMTTYCVGHAHLDTGWLWPVKESIRKAARTFAHQIKLIEKYPDYIFGASQPQHFQFLKDYYPGLYKEVKKQVEAGRIELQGGMWVEADCNLISGESMIRQILYGKNFFKDEFGIDVDNLWLPDVFGYSAAMPQILQKSGITTFMTQKISWNQFNKFPHHTFMWEGIDGTDILTHFLPTDTYNSYLTPKELIDGEKRFVENDVLDEFLTAFGIGDGGGGPREEQLERAIRMKNLEGVPKVKLSAAAELFSKLHKAKNKLNRWSGELYLELHRGTLTTQADVKKNNRRLERSLLNIEQIASLLPYDNYPKTKLDTLYKKLLINQFHDILPGSSINKVYQNTRKEYNECNLKVNELLANVAKKIFKEDNESIVVYNPLSFEFNNEFIIDHNILKSYDLFDGNTLIETQECESGVACSLNLKPFEFKTLTKKEKTNTTNSKDSDSFILENNLVKYTFNNNGVIVAAFDKELNKNFMVLGNEFSLYSDMPNNWDAWDIDFTYENCLLEHANCTNKENHISGNILSSLKFNYTISSSKISQYISLNNNSKALKIHTNVQWNERHKMLRLAFETSIRSDNASYDIQSGYVKRPTHRNSNLDVAKFECVAHKYTDISDFDYGVALLNDCKYGHKVFGSTLDINLLRSTTSPDADADIGVHDIVTTIYPHHGQLQESKVYEQSAMLNCPPLIFNNKNAIHAIKHPFEIKSAKGINLEVIKHAEKENMHIIRLVETKGRVGNIVLKFNKQTKIIESDLMEWNDISVQTTELLDLNFKPFEIKTFKFKV